MMDNKKCSAPASGSASEKIRPTHSRGSLAERIRHIWRAYWEWRARRAAVLLLESLDDRTLNDIGLTPDDTRSGSSTVRPGTDRRTGGADARTDLLRPSGRSLGTSR